MGWVIRIRSNSWIKSTFNKYKKIRSNVFITSSSESSPISFQASNHLQEDVSITNQKCHIALEHAQEVEVASLYVRIIGFDGFVRPLLQF